MTGEIIGPANTIDKTDDTGSASSERRERSTIKFPYGDLETAIALASTLHEHAGVRCEVDQLAEWAGQRSSSGTFRSRLSTTKIFGLIETERGQAILTTIGRNIISSDKERASRAQAFLAVPLYQVIYDEYRGYTLPPPAALERRMIECGVSSKQADKARRALMRSALQAGFFEHGNDKLVLPAPKGPGTKPVEPPKRGSGGGGEDRPPLDPIIQGLINKLPPPGGEWPGAQRKLWLEILENTFKLVYKDQTADISHPSNETTVDEG